MARLTSTDRSALPDRAFAYIDSDGNRRLPINDAAHVRAALARFGQVQFEDDAARDRARRRLLQAAKRHRVVPIGFITSEIEVGQRARPLPDELPSGFVTMLMTDIEGSTGLVGRLGAEFATVLDRMWESLRTTVAQLGGRAVEARADEFFAVFEAPRPAVDAAIEMQHALARQPLVDGADVRIRIGLHSGYPTPSAGNYVGLDVHATSRITFLGHGGQIIASANTRDAVRATNPKGVRFVDLGSHRLRGISEPMPLFQVASRGLTSRFPPLRTS